MLMLHISHTNSYPAMIDAMQVNGSIYFGDCTGMLLFLNGPVSRKQMLIW